MPSPSNGSPFVRSPLTWLLYILLGLFSFGLTMIAPAVPYLRAEFNLDYTMAALHLSMFAMGMVVTGLFAHRILDLTGQSRGIWIGSAGMAGGAVLLALAPWSWLTLGSILLMSLFGTLLLAAIQATLASQYDQYRGKAVMEANVVASLASASAPFILAFGASTFLGWRILSPTLAIALVLAFVMGRKITSRAAVNSSGDSPDAPGRLPAAFWISWFLIICGVAVEWCLGFWSAEYLKGMAGVTVGQAVLGAGVFQIAAVAGRFLSSRLAGRISDIRLMALAMVLVAAGFPLYWLKPGLLLAYTGLALCGAGAATFYPLAFSVAAEASGARTRKASSYASIASGMAIGLAPLLLGGIADQSNLESALLAVPVALALMGGLLVLRKLTGRSRS